MMYCPKCGISLPDDATECDACGARIDPIPETTKKTKTQLPFPAAAFPIEITPVGSDS